MRYGEPLPRFLVRRPVDLVERLAERGVNCVRIPVGHWLFGPPYPYHEKYGKNPHPFVTGGLDVRDPAIRALFPAGGRAFLLGRDRLFSFAVGGGRAESYGT